MDQAKDNDMGSSYLATHTMGSGAYEITSYTPSQSIKLDVQKIMPARRLLLSISSSTASKIPRPSGCSWKGGY